MRSSENKWQSYNDNTNIDRRGARKEHLYANNVGERGNNTAVYEW